MKLFLALLFVFIIRHYNCQTVDLEYSELKKAYENYDTAFFFKLQGKQVNVLKNGKYFRRDRPGIGFTPILDWYLNKKVDFTEYDFETMDSLFILKIYQSDINKKIEYQFRFSGSKPQIQFKKGKKNWYKILRLQDCILIKHDESELSK